MRFVVDRNIPQVGEAFAPFGEVVAVGTEAFTPAAVRDADGILVRSETQVNRALLDGSRVRFVGSATIGTDHVDLDYLAARGITFANAPGCNANAVKEYVVAALLHLAVNRGFSLAGKTLGVVGVGHVGSRVVAAGQALGLRVLQNDPPLARRTGQARFVPLDALMDADIITLHVPLTRIGPDPTEHLFDGRSLARLKGDAILVNTSRGGVVDTEALKEFLRADSRRVAVLDVWKGEPRIDTGLLALAALATPHIAGYSLEGKLQAVSMVREAACRFAGITASWEPRMEDAGNGVLDLRALPPDGGAEALLHEAVRRSYDIALDDRNLRRLLDLPPELHAAHFSGLRTSYRVRREFSALGVTPDPERPGPGTTLAALGFRMQSPV